MNQELNSQEIMDILNLLVQRTEQIGDIVSRTQNLEIKLTEHDNYFSSINKRFDKVDEEIKTTDLKLETKIEPTLQLILENQTEVINQKSTITVVENKQEELKDRVDVIEYAVKQNQSDIEELKKRA